MTSHVLLAIASCLMQSLGACSSPIACSSIPQSQGDIRTAAELGIVVARGQRVRVRTVSHTPPVVLRPGSFELPVNQYTPRILALLSAFPVQSIGIDGAGRPNRVILGGTVPEGLMEAARNGPVALDWVRLDAAGNTIAYQLARP